MYRFEWNYDEIKNQETFDELVEYFKNTETGFNDMQGARLFYEGKDRTVMIELQIPTKDMIDLTEVNEIPWFDAYEVDDLEDYDASNEIYTGIGYGENITFENAEQLMLELAKELCG